MLDSKLYLCPTPIGNMEDMTLRALRVLRECHRIYCEDTRNTGAMLSRLGISKPLISCHEHNEEGRAEEIAGRVAEGEAIAFVSDAGLPGISDPGERLVAAFIQRGLPFEVLPGPSASLTALVLSGLPAKEACFVGFLPRSGKERREAVARLARHRGYADSVRKSSESCRNRRRACRRMGRPGGGAVPGAYQIIRGDGALHPLWTCRHVCS